MKLARLLAVLTLSAVWAFAQQPESTKGTDAAKAEFQKGNDALRQSDWDGAVEHFGKAVELDADFFDAHEQYVFVSTAGPKNYNNEKLFAELDARYKAWAREHPDKAVYRYSLGHLYFYKNPEQAVKYYQEAVELDPKFAPAWDSLGIMAEAQGRLDDERVYERKAAEAWSDNIRYARHSADAWMMADFSLFRKASMEFIDKHPDDAAGQLSYLALRAQKFEDSKATLELIYQKYMPQGAQYLTQLFQYYVREDPAKAVKLAVEAQKALPNDKTWPQLAAYGKAVVDGRAALAGQKPHEALDLTDALKLPPRTDQRMLDILRAQALATAGQADAAYSGLLKTYAAAPNDEVRTALLALGKKQDKTPAAVDADVYKQRMATAKPGIPFATTIYPDNRPIKLDDYRGKVFLLNFWYPLCGPCRGEFPSLQAVLDKYKSRGFSIVAINVHPNEDSWVMPLIQGWKLGFLPIHGGDDLMKAYNVRGAPSNFLYGPDGKIYYTPGPVNTFDARRTLELQIEALLDQLH